MQVRIRFDTSKPPTMIRGRDLVPNPLNWRSHPQHQGDALRGILAEVGVTDVLKGVRLPDGRVQLIDGHLRAETLPDQEIPVILLDINEEEAKKVLATFDTVGDMAEIDTENLAALLKQVETDSPAVLQMLQELAERGGLETEETPEPGDGGDEFDATPEEGPTRAQLGDLWLIGGKHRLLVGDCTIAANVEKLFDGAVPDMMVTDPPYGVNYDPEWRMEAGISHNEKKMGKVANDDRADWADAWKLFPGGVAYVWHDGLHAATVQRSLEDAGFVLRAQIVWAKDRLAMGRGDYHWKHEPCWYAVRDGMPGLRTDDRTQTTLWEIVTREDSGHGHGTQKPVECMLRPQRNHDCQSVYDPFLGSGTTLIAAHRLGRVCYGCELEPKYADVIIKRAESEGMTAVRLEPGPE